MFDTWNSWNLWKTKLCLTKKKIWYTVIVCLDSNFFFGFTLFCVSTVSLKKYYLLSGCDSEVFEA